jgi:HAD superfamily hydrolase (TIGR01509 family)
LANGAIRGKWLFTPPGRKYILAAGPPPKIVFGVETGRGEDGVKLILFDWGDTVMRDFRQYDGPMHMWPEVAALPGAMDALSKIRPSRIIALATNALDSREEEIRAALRRASIDHLVDRIYCFSGIGFMKPAREFYTHILNDLHLDPREAIMVGDDFEKDILGANRAGIFAIWINHGSSERRVGKSYDTIYSLFDLPSAVGRRESLLMI